MIWAFTDLSDKRWQFTRKYVLLRQDPKSPSPQKIGSFNPETFGAYYLGKRVVRQALPGQPDQNLS